MISMLVLAPAAGALLLALLPKQIKVKWVGTAAAGVPLFLAVWMYVYVQTGRQLADFNIRHRWFQLSHVKDTKLFAADFALSMDGLSLLLVLVAVLAAMTIIYRAPGKRSFLCKVLVFETSVLGTLTAQDLLLFYCFFECSAVALYFLTAQEEETGRKAAFSFLVTNAAGSALLLGSILFMFARTGTADLSALKQIMTSGGISLIAPVSDSAKSVLFFTIAGAFLLKAPVFPFHRWLLQVHKEGKPAASLLSAALFMKMSLYGIIRFGVGIFPSYFQEYAQWLAWIGLAGLLYGTVRMLIQKDWKQLLGYYAVSQSGLMLLGISTGTEAGVKGAAILMAADGLIALLLYRFTGVMEPSRLKKRSLPAWLASAGLLAAMGMPGLPAFNGIYRILTGLSEVDSVLFWAALLCSAASAFYLLRYIWTLWTGPIEQETPIHRGWKAEWALLFVLLAAGLVPGILFKLPDGSIEWLLLGIGG